MSAVGSDPVGAGSISGKCARVSVMASAQLAVLAAGAVDARDDGPAVRTGLAGHAGGDAVDSPTARFQDGIAAFDTVLGPLTGGHVRARSQDGVVDLI